MNETDKDMVYAVVTIILSICAAVAAPASWHWCVFFSLIVLCPERRIKIRP